MKRSFILFLLWILLGCAGLALAQGPPGSWQPITLSSNSIPIEIVTVGGISYARYTVTIEPCTRIATVGPVIRNANVLSCDFDLEHQIGVLCAQIVYMVDGVAVLGALHPGDYTFTTTSWGTPVASQAFQVPTNTGPTIQALGFGADGSFRMQLNGITNVSYILQASTNLVDWTSISTNVFGSTLTDMGTATLGRRFYRVRIGR
jgi:hypothetical protein